MTLWLAVLAFSFQGSRGLWEPDEGRYVSVALRMLDRGDFLVPYADAEHPHLSKPPLTYWTLAASFATFGRNEWAARTPNAVAFVLTGLLVLWLALMMQLRAPWFAAVIWSTTILPFIASNSVTTDGLLALFETLAVCGYVWGTSSSDATGKGLWLMWMGLALAFLTKGPPALIPLLPIMVISARRGGWRSLAGLFSPGPTLAFLALALSWFLYLVAKSPPLAQYFLMDEFVDRVGTDMHHRNPGWKGLLEVFASVATIGALPWSLVGLGGVWMRRRRAGAAAISIPATVHAEFLIWWMAVPLVVFALAQSRLPLYLLPLFVPFSLWVSRSLEQARYRPGAIARASLIIWFGILLALKAGAAYWWPTSFDARAMAAELRRTIDIENYDELVFVNRKAAYGLRLYLPLEIEQVTIHRTPGSYAGAVPIHGICEELAERQAPLFVVSEAAGRSVIEEAQRCGRIRLYEAGRFRGQVLIARAPGPRSPT